MDTTKKQFDSTPLSPEALQALQKKRLTSTYRFDKLLPLLRELAVFDDRTDALRSRKVKFTLLGMILGIVLLVIGAVANSVPVLMTLAMVASIILVIFGIVNWIQYAKLKKMDLENNFRKTLLPLLEALAEDVKSKGKVLLELNMSNPLKRKPHSKQKIPSRFKKLTETIFLDPWCSFTAPLEDGNRLSVKVENHDKKYDRVYRSRSGKTKHKTKWKRLVVVTTAVLPDETQVTVEEAPPSDVQGKIKVRQKGARRLCQLERKFKFPGGYKRATQMPPTSEIVGMLMQLYSMLKPVSNGSAHHD